MYSNDFFHYLLILMIKTYILLQYLLKIIIFQKFIKIKMELKRKMSSKKSDALAR